ALICVDEVDEYAVMLCADAPSGEWSLAISAEQCEFPHRQGIRVSTAWVLTRIRDYCLARR
ncbi:MAG: hypothetical protein ACRCVV_09935, partial [Shewanella sp.]